MNNKIFMIVLLISITGSVVSIIFMLSENIIHQFTSAKFITLLNIFTIGTFLIPFYEIFSTVNKNGYLFSNFTYVKFIEKENIKDSVYLAIKNSSIAGVIIIIWILGMVLYLLIYIMQYKLLMKEIFKKYFMIDNEVWLNTWQLICNDNKCLENVKLIVSERIDEPCTIGVFKKYIVIPPNILDKLNKDEIQFILEHETIHIKKNDIFLKIFVMVINSINWFNPVFYILKRHLFELIELRCDECLVFNYSNQQRNAYINLIFDLILAETKKAKEYDASYFISKNERFLKRRVYAIMKGKNKNNLFKTIIFSSFMALTITSAAYATEAFAYMPVYEIFSNSVDIMNKENFSIVKDIKKGLNGFDYNWIADEENKELLPVNINNNINANVSAEIKHIHNLKEIFFTNHEKYNNGSCKMTIYKANQCTECGVIRDKETINTETYDKCPH